MLKLRAILHTLSTNTGLCVLYKSLSRYESRGRSLSYSSLHIASWALNVAIDNDVSLGTLELSESPREQLRRILLYRSIGSDLFSSVPRPRLPYGRERLQKRIDPKLPA